VTTLLRRFARAVGTVALGGACGAVAAALACAVWGSWVTSDAQPGAPSLAVPMAFAAVVGGVLGAGLGPLALALLPGVPRWRAALGASAGAFAGGAAAALSPAIHPILSALVGFGVAALLLRRSTPATPAGAP
jgi:hypothetical protein